MLATETSTQINVRETLIQEIDQTSDCLSCHASLLDEEHQLKYQFLSLPFVILQWMEILAVLQIVLQTQCDTS